MHEDDLPASDILQGLLLALFIGGAGIAAALLVGIAIYGSRESELAAKLEVSKSCERNTRVAVAALNGWRIEEGDVTVACRRVRNG